MTEGEIPGNTGGARGDAGLRSVDVPGDLSGRQVWRVFSRAALAPLLWLAGCAVGPQYQPPVPAAPAQFDNAVAASSAAEPQHDFWRRFEDPVLNGLVERALSHNRDLAIAVANLREARAAAGFADAQRYPEVTAGASSARSLRSQLEAPGASRDDRTGTSHSIGLQAIWELDFYGRLAREAEASEAIVAATQAGVAAVQTSVVAELAAAYFELRGTQRRVQVARAAIDNQQRVLELVEARLAAGRGTELDVTRARALLESTRAQLPAFDLQLAQLAYRIATLTGQPPASTGALRADAQPLPGLPAVDGIGDPAGLMRRRPDIRQAERVLAAATHRIGVATADLFPQVSIGGLIGLNAARFSLLDRGSAVRYSAGASMSWSLFDFGRVRARIAAAEARTEGALAQYERAVLLALEETEGALVRLNRTQERTELLALAAAASFDAARLATARFTAGTVDLLIVLDAERQLLASQDALAVSETAGAASIVFLYRALGGGWQVPGTVGAASADAGGAS